MGFKLFKDVLYINLDELFLKGSELSNMESDYFICLSSLFNGNLGFGNLSNGDLKLDIIKSKYRLSYNLIDIIYFNENYKINYSLSSKKHGKILGLKSYVLNYNRPFAESLNDFYLLYDLRYFSSLLNNNFFLESCLELEIKNNLFMDYSNIRMNHLFLHSNFRLSVENLLIEFFDNYFISKQEFLDTFLISNLKSILDGNGYYYDVQMNKDDSTNVIYKKSSGIGFNVKVYEKVSNNVSLSGYKLFLRYLSEFVLHDYIDVNLLFSLENRNRLINLKYSFIY